MKKLHIYLPIFFTIFIQIGFSKTVTLTGPDCEDTYFKFTKPDSNYSKSEILFTRY